MSYKADIAKLEKAMSMDIWNDSTLKSMKVYVDFMKGKSGGSINSFAIEEAKNALAMLK